MKSFLSLIVFTALIACCHGQTFTEIDSVKDLLRQAKDSGKTDKGLYYTSYIAYLFFTNSKYDSALHYYYEILRNRDKAYSRDLLASVLNGVGACYSRVGYLDSSIHYYNQALRLYSELRDTLRVNEIEINLSIIYKDNGLYEKALENSFHVLSKLERRPPDRAIASCYTTIGFVYSALGDYQNALEYHQKALLVRKKIGYDKGVGQSYNNLGDVHRDMHAYDSALFYLYRSLEVKRSVGDKNQLASTLNNIGDVLLQLGREKDAEPYFRESLTIKREANDREGQIISLNSLGQLKLKQHDLGLAGGYLQEAGVLAGQVGGLEYLKRNLELKVQLYRAKKDYRAAYQCTEELLAVKESLLNSDKVKSLQAMKLQYETEKMEQQIASLEQRDRISQAEIQTKHTQVRALEVGVLLLIIIAALIYVNFRIIRKNKSRVETLLKELHHRVKNNLQILSSVLSLQSQQLTDESAIQAVRSNEGRINAMALIHKKLYREEGQDRSINMKEYIAELIEYLVYTYGYHEKDLKLDLSIEEIQVDVDKAIPLGLVLNEIISNAFKHAYTHQDHPELSVKLKQSSISDIQIRIGDNGVGISQRQGDSGEIKFGVKMVNALMKDLKGRYDIHHNPGTLYILTIPL